ncbi:MAG TPA: FAD-linked oxidase C-terminal domain-containing protein [Polyangiaceae bacterium]|nr:FAD-linked oxidase C-terminal domain-containing protein [Polyangiaceae bacterium]
MINLSPLLPAPSAAQVEKALSLLGRKLGPSKLLTQAESCAAYARDESEAIGRQPHCVVIAENEGDIQAALAAAHDAEVPITPRSGGTGRSGGAVPLAGGIVLSTHGMNQVKDIDRRELCCVVQPGVILGDLHNAVERENLFYPPDANSLLACTLGGNVACNAGGPRAFKYGVTRNYVLGMEAMLIGGQRIFAGKRTVKGVTGYDVASLLVGSEGTLAIFGDITLRLRVKPEQVMTVLALFKGVHDATAAVGAIIAAGLVPRCMELLDQQTLTALRAAGNPLNEDAGALLLMDVDGDEGTVMREAERIGELCTESKAQEVLVAQDAAQRDRLWAARREMSPAVRRMTKNKLSEDVVVPRQKIGTLLDLVAKSCEKLKVRHLTYGHAGDGNMHCNFLWNDDSEEAAVGKAIEQLFVDVVSLGGTLSGEHGIGVLKAPYLHLEQSPQLIELQRQIKNVFDPKGLLNPGKIFGAPGHGAC